MKDSEAVTFAAETFDRATHLRGDAAAQARMKDDPTARALAFWRGKPVFEGTDRPALCWLPMDAPVLAEAAVPPIFLGLEDGAPRFAYDVSAWTDPGADAEALASFRDHSANQHPSFASDQAFRDLRMVMGMISSIDAGNAAGAKGIFGWHDNHRFCAQCGAPSDVTDAGWQRTCPACDAKHFPRTDPVVIMLIVSGDKVLMGRSPGWPEGMYSLLAGFMEPGETIEAAVRREVFEEAGVPVGDVGYLSSQPWPFPASLMIGCWGRALSESITLDPVELEDAIWVTRQDMMEIIAGNNPAMKPARYGAIARFLLDRWLSDSVRLEL